MDSSLSALRSSRKLLFQLSVLVILFFQILTAAVAGGLDLASGSKDMPIEITADNGIEWEKNKETLIASGNAKASRGGITLLAEELRAGMGVESALDAIANSRSDRMGIMLKDAVSEMRDAGFGDAMKSFATKTESPMISRIVSILNVALGSSGSFATTLENISEEFWEIYMLRKERITNCGRYNV